MSSEDNKKVVLLVLIGVVCLITGFVLMFISSVKKDQKELNSRISTIVTSYKKFKNNLEKVNKERDDIHKEFLDTIYYETFQQNDTSYKNKLLAYEENITKLSKNNSKLKEYCNSGVYYSSTDANNKCRAFNLAYEEMINSFVDDISMYNKNINTYNKWLKDKGDTTSIILEKYKTKKTYIDFNQDGDYSGKESKNEAKKK